MVGTRPAPSNSQSGSVYVSAPSGGSNTTPKSFTYALTFPNEFDSVPKVTYTYSGSDRVYCNSVSNVTRTGCVFNCTTQRSGTGYGITIHWVAMI